MRVSETTHGKEDRRLDTGAALQRFINEELLNGQMSVGLDENLLSIGMIDSLGVMRLIAFIAEEFGVEVPPEDLTIENFRTVAVMARYVSQRRA